MLLPAKTPGRAYCLTNSKSNPTGAGSSYFPGIGSGSDPLNSNTRRNLTNRSTPAIYLLENLRP